MSMVDQMTGFIGNTLESDCFVAASSAVKSFVKDSYYNVPLWQPIVGVIVYLLVNKLLSRFNVTVSAKTSKIFALIHNIVLIVFSGATVIGTILLLAKNWEWNKIFNPECTHMMSDTESYISSYFIGYCFYISKYYEFIDTWLILLKGKKPSFLQTSHHAGTVWCLACMMHFRSENIWLGVLLNACK
eukprot:TRINITY_DN497_c0_g1_i2.p1 TRINITY_DN497_c0_g1~~TRINITY_DN497_c0_g1_i2.p1  ORF type:complete len:187 (+),score=33.56 TRINITY_DN497_c0_g1_i2:51-611(+)